MSSLDSNLGLMFVCEVILDFKSRGVREEIGFTSFRAALPESKCFKKGLVVSLVQCWRRVGQFGFLRCPTLWSCGWRSFQAEATLPELFAAPKVRLPPMAAPQAPQMVGLELWCPTFRWKILGDFGWVRRSEIDMTSMTSPTLKEVLERQRQNARPPSSSLDFHWELRTCWAKGSQTRNPNVLSS